MASRRILSNSNLAPIQELAVNPYSSFNSDHINRLTRIVSGGKDKDVIVNGLDVNSFTDKKWYAGPELLPSLNDTDKWSGKNYYILNKTSDGLHDIDPVVHLELPHENSYGFSYINCKIDDSCVNHLYKSSYPKVYEVSFTLDFGTPKTIIAKLNNSEVTINHPEAGKRYSLDITKYFKNDTLTEGLTFTIGAILDGADPDCKFETAYNKTYIVISHISFRMKGYELPQFPKTFGPIQNNYGIYGVHPTHYIDIDPGVAIKDDVMLEEMAPCIDKFKKFRLDLSNPKSWIKNNPFTLTDFSSHGDQYAYQCNDNGDVYKKRFCRFDSDGIKVEIRDHDNQPKWVRPTDDIVLTYDVDGNNLDRQFAFDRYSDDDEFHNFTLYSDGSILDSVSSYSNTVIVCFVDDDGKYRIIGYKINIIKAGKGIKAPEISPITPDVKEINADDQAANITFDNGSSFEIPILSYTLPKKISDYGADWRNRIKGFISIGPTKVSGDLNCYNKDAVQWGYVVLYYAYFKNPKPNTSYIGLIRESDLEQNRDDYLILAKVRFVDPNTVDIISYEDRQSKQIPSGNDVTYYSTCDYPEIWNGDIPQTVTDAINELALFDHNFARLIRFKHDFNAELDTSFHLANPNASNSQQTPFIHVNDNGHLERKIRINKDKLILKSFIEEYKRLLPEKNCQFTCINSAYTTYSYTGEDGVEWRIKLDPVMSDIPVVTDYSIRVRAAMGKYDTTSGKISYSFISFNNVGPFKFVDIVNGKDACEIDWLYYDEILVYPTSPSITLESQTLVYPTSPYSTIDTSTGIYKDVDKGILSGEKYLDEDSGMTGGRFLLAYDTPTNDTTSILNSGENHFKYLVFRNRLLISNYFLKLLDILPKKSIGKNSRGNFVYEGLIENRILQGSSGGDGSNVHIESSNVEISDQLVNGNLLKNDNIGMASVIKSSDYAIPNKKTGDSYSYVNDSTSNYKLVDEAILTSKQRDDKTTDIISSDYAITATGNGNLLNSSIYDRGLVAINSTKHSISDELINGNIIRAKVTDKEDKLESTSYSIPNKKIGTGTPSTCTYDFSESISTTDPNYYQLSDEALLMAKKRNDNTVDIISSKYVINAGTKGQVLVSENYGGSLTSIKSSKHYISEDLKHGNLIIAENPASGDSDGDRLKSSIYAIPDIKTAASDPLKAVYSFTGSGTYKLLDNALLTAKKRNDDVIDIISSKYLITAGGDNKIVVSEYVDPSHKSDSLINLKSSEFTPGDFIGHWFAPKVELRSDQWWNLAKPRIVVVIDTVHNFTIKVSQIIKAIHDQFADKYSYGDGEFEFDDATFNSMFNSSLSIKNQKVCDITVVLDLTAGNQRPKYIDSKDGYSAIESLCKSKFVLVNDINPITTTEGTFKPYVEMKFDYSDSVKSKGGTIHYEGTEVVYGFDTDKEFTGTHRSAEHLHSEPLEQVSETWKLIADYNKQPKNMIWHDQYRGYNNSKLYEDEEVTKSTMRLYPVNDTAAKLTNISALEYDPDSTVLGSGYGYCRGPLLYVFAGNKAEYTFNHVKTFNDVDGVVYPQREGKSLFTCSKCNDVIYGESKYYVISSQF